MYSWAKVTSRSCIGCRAGELERVVVVVEDEVAVQAARQSVRLRRLAAVGRRVAEEGAADLVEVDVGLAPAAALAAVGLGVAPAELAVLDRVDVLGDRLDRLDEVGDAVAVRRRSSEGASSPSATQWTQKWGVQAGERGASGTRVGVAVGVGVVGGSRRGRAEDPLIAGARPTAGSAASSGRTTPAMPRSAASAHARAAIYSLARRGPPGRAAILQRVTPLRTAACA